MRLKKQEKKKQGRFSTFAVQGVIAVLATFGLVAFSASAGTLTPPSGTPVATFYTLTDIYDLINSNTTTTEGDHDFTFNAALSGSGYTLTQIYDALTGLITAGTVLTGNTYLGVAGTFDATNLHTTTVKSGVEFGAGLTGIYPSVSAPLPDADGSADLEASGGNITSSNGAVEWWHASGTRYTATLDFPTLSNVCSTDTSNNATGTLSVTTSTLGVGYTYCGTAGAILQNLFNGSSSTFPGGTQESGGIDDFNAGLSAGPPSDRYKTAWTTCDVGNNYCGTGNSGADVKDEVTGLVWSETCANVGCTSFTDTTGTNYSWDTSGASNGGMTAAQLCEQHTGWYMPHQKQMMQAYINGAMGTVLNASSHWVGTASAAQATHAWFTNLRTGQTDITAKTVTVRIRCVYPTF